MIQLKNISRLGFGAWPLGNTAHGKTMREAEAISLVKKAFEQGIRFFDTAPNYALGQSETILGKALKNDRDKVFINSKFGHHPDDSIDFSEAKMVASLEGSLNRLQTDYLDGFILHNPAFDVLQGKTKHFEILKQLKASKRIRGYGVSVDTPEELTCVLENHHVDIIEVLFNIFSQEARHFFKTIQERNIILIIKVPLDSGWLTGKYNENSVFTDIRARWQTTDKKRRSELLKRLSNLLEKPINVELAIGYILSYNAVSTVIPGIRTESQLNELVQASQTHFPEDIKREIERFYDSFIKESPLPW